MHRFPESAARLLWDVNVQDADPWKHRDYVMERVMQKGTWKRWCGFDSNTR